MQRWQRLIEWFFRAMGRRSRFEMKRVIALRSLNQRTHFSIYSLVGQFDDKRPSFVRHVALLAKQQELPATVSVLHMGPPLVSIAGDLRVSDSDRELTPHIVFAFSLDEAQKAKVGRWTARIATEDGPLDKRRYVIKPHMKAEKSERGVIKYHRFNCAGYAFEAFRQIDIVLCEADKLPLIDESKLIPIYNDLPKVMKSKQIRSFLGIGDDPPWSVMLPGYLFYGAEAIANRFSLRLGPEHTEWPEE